MKKTTLVAVVSLSLCSATAFADRNGIFSVGAAGCNGCHFGGATPTINLQLSKTEVAPGETIDATVTVSNSNNGTGGFLLRATTGKMVNPGTGVKVLGAGATHNAPKLPDMSNQFVFHVQWTAPTTGGQVTFNAYGNATNNNNLEGGDKGVSTSQVVSVCGTAWFPDMDGDGYGTGAGTVACSAPPGSVNQGGDCDDTNAAVNPNVFETCGNGIDDDCNGVVDDPAMCGGSGNDAGTTGGNDAGNGGGTDGGVDAGTGGEQVGGCSCGATSGGSGAVFALAAMALFLMRRRAA